jgi:acylphosphatase
MLVARRFRVSGRVQGVGFRFFAQEAAAHEGLSGWVRNLDDGQVEALVEGDREAVKRFERKIRRGPPAARVEDVFVDDDTPSGRGGGFLVRS